MQDRNLRKPVVIVLMGAFWPGNEASGPIQSFKGMAKTLSGEFDFRLVARDRPFGATARLPPTGPMVDGWIDLGFAKARYLPVGRFGAQGLGKLLAATPHDLVWLNGFFDREFTIPTLIRRRTGMGPSPPVLLSPRGEFGGGALELKAGRKRGYLALCRAMGLLSGVTIHATSDKERRDIDTGVGGQLRIEVVPNVAALPPPPAARGWRGDGVLRLSFIGRIARVKNLDFALRTLAQVQARVHLSIYGPAQEADHWDECRRLIASLPDNASAEHMGELTGEQITAALDKSDLLLLPTKGENFGHAIFEALACGVPVLISDQTPWRDLERDGAGWDLQLDSPGRFAKAIDEFARLQDDTRARMSQAARLRAELWLEQSDAVGRTRAMLTASLANRK